VLIGNLNCTRALKHFVSYLALLFLIIIFFPADSISTTSSGILSSQLFREIKVLDSVENTLKEIILSKQYSDSDELFIISSIKQMIRTTQAVLIGQMELINIDKYIDTEQRQEYSEQRFNSINLKKVVLNANMLELKRLNSYISNGRVEALTKKSTDAINRSLMLLDNANKIYEIEILRTKGSKTP
jgi:hypothetical protein